MKKVLAPLSIGNLDDLRLLPFSLKINQIIKLVELLYFDDVA